MTKVQAKKNIFYFELSSKQNVDIEGITVSMQKKHQFETIFTSNDVMNIQYGIGKVFGSRERSYYVGVNDYFGHRQTNIPHATLNYEPGKSGFEVDYYRHKYCSPGKYIISENNWTNQVKK